MIEIPLEWTDFKNLVINTKKLNHQYTETSISYEIFAIDYQIYYSSSLTKGSTDSTDFINNYQSIANRLLNQSFTIVASAPTNISPIKYYNYFNLGNTGSFSNNGITEWTIGSGVIDVSNSYTDITYAPSYSYTLVNAGFKYLATKPSLSEVSLNFTIGGNYVISNKKISIDYDNEIFSTQPKSINYNASSPNDNIAIFRFVHATTNTTKIELNLQVYK